MMPGVLLVEAAAQLARTIPETVAANSFVNPGGGRIYVDIGGWRQSVGKSTWSGWVYVAFVIDAYSRRILGWRTATTMTTPLVLDAIEHAIWTRRREGITDLSGLIHHNDRGSQGVFNRSSQHLPDRGVR